MRIIIATIFACLGVISSAQCSSAIISSSQKVYCISDFVELSVSNVPSGSTIEWKTSSIWDTSGFKHSVSPTTTGPMDVSVRFTLASGTVCTVDR